MQIKIIKASVLIRLPEERALTGTWVTIEVEKAQSLGYRILEKYEAWHFPITTQYDLATKTGGIWSECIDLWLKHKQQASGWPAWCVTDEQKQKYINDYEKYEGIRLEGDQIKKNEGLRSLAKLLLNSMWGKMGQKPNKSKITYVAQCTEYVEMLTNNALEITDLFNVNDEHIAVLWKQKSDFVQSLPNTNVVLAVTTAPSSQSQG